MLNTVTQSARRIIAPSIFEPSEFLGCLPLRRTSGPKPGEE